MIPTKILLLLFSFINPVLTVQDSLSKVPEHACGSSREMDLSYEPCGSDSTASGGSESSESNSGHFSSREGNERSSSSGRNSGHFSKQNVERLINDIASLQNKIAEQKALPLTASERTVFLREAVKILSAQVARRDHIRDHLIHTLDQHEVRHRILEEATLALKASKAHYQASEWEDGQIAGQIGEILLDLTTSVAPGLSVGRDLYEALTGKDLISGETLDTFARSLAVIGIVTLGFGSKIGKALKVVNKLMKGEKAAEALKTSEKILEAANKFDVPSNKLGEYMGRLREAGKTKGNFDFPKGTKSEANFLGESWVGANAKKTPYQNHLGKSVFESQDGTKLFREPVTKRDGRTLANFQWKDQATGKWIGNGHMTITD